MHNRRQHMVPRIRNRNASLTRIFMVAVGLSVGVVGCGTADTVVPSDSDNVEASTPETPEPTVTEAIPGVSPDTGPALATAELVDIDGKAVGEVTFTAGDGSLHVSISAEGLTPGFYGWHVHQIGKCEPDSAAPNDPADTGAFKSSGGHIPGDGAAHPNHAGDLPTLLVDQDGDATMTVSTDRLDESLLLDSDGSAVIIHSKPDNFANIPERYAPNGPDEETTKAGDAGTRVACGVVES